MHVASALSLPYEVLYPPGCFGPYDEWLRRRVVHTLTCMEERPDVPLSCTGQGRAERVGALRMVGHEEVDFERLFAPAAEACAQVVREGGAGRVALCVHDRTEVELSHLQMRGAGEVGNPRCRGFFLQTGLVLEAGTGAALGAVSARLWTRPPAQHGKAQSRKARPFEEKESALWWQGILEAESRVACARSLLHVIDREGDVFEVFLRAQSAGVQLLTRAAQDRCVEGEAGAKLWAALEALAPSPHVHTLQVPARPAQGKRPAQPAREAHLHLRYGPLTLRPPRSSAPQGTPGVQVWGVLVREESAPQGVEPLEWLLLTNVPVDSDAAAWGVVRAYAYRWRIEELHKALKTGCRLEERQHEDVRTLQNVLALLLQTSIRLLRLRTLVRVHPEAPATLALGEAHVQVLRHLAPRVLPRLGLAPDVPLTLQQAFALIAVLGGHAGTPSAKPAGWLVLWRGYERLHERVEGFLLAQSLTAPSPALRV
jgi:hypothetical protein